MHVSAVELARLPTARDLDALLAAIESGAYAMPSPESPNDPPSPAAAPPKDRAPSQLSPRDEPHAPGAPPASTRQRASAERSTPSPNDGAEGTRGAQASATTAGVAVAPKPAVSTIPSLRAVEVQSRWAEILDVAAEKKPALARLLDHVSVRGVRGQSIHISVDPDAVAARQAFVRPEYQMALGQLLRDVCGQFLRPVVVAEGPRHMDGLVAEDDLHDPTISRVVQRVDGRLLWVKDVGNRKHTRS